MKSKVKQIENYNIYEEIWFEKYNLLKEYVLSHNGQFPTRNVEGIGYWLENQKRFLKNGKMSAERKELLDSLGEWNSPVGYENKWNNNFKRLMEFVIENERFPKQKENEEGCWLDHQRQKFRKNTLDESKIKMLDSLGEWNVTDKYPKKIK